MRSNSATVIVSATLAAGSFLFGYAVQGKCHTPPPDDGNPVGFHATGKAQIPSQFRWPPPCLANQTCTVTIDLVMPNSTSNYKCATSYCLKFQGTNMAVNSLDWDNSPHPDNLASSEPKNITGTIYIGP